MNGALTLSTLDGANVELRDAVGRDNFLRFGLSLEQVRALQRGITAPRCSSPTAGGTLGDRHRYAAVVEQLRVHDPYSVCADFETYLAAEREAATLYGEPRAWSRCALLNIAGASAFSSDATIQAYAHEIWHITPLTRRSQELFRRGIAAELDATSRTRAQELRSMAARAQDHRKRFSRGAVHRGSAAAA